MMMINIMMATHLIKLALFSFLLFYFNSSNGQCLDYDKIDGYNLNKIYTLDSLIVQHDFIPLLDHAISLLDTFNIEKDSTWLYYMICLNSKSIKEYGLETRISLRQGEDGNFLFYETTVWKDYLSGAFCYKGYTFFVLLNPRNEELFNKLFSSTKIKKDFPVVYKTPIISQLGVKLDFGLYKYILLYYYYRNGQFYYTYTDYDE